MSVTLLSSCKKANWEVYIQAATFQAQKYNLFQELTGKANALHTVKCDIHI